MLKRILLLALLLPMLMLAYGCTKEEGPSGKQTINFVSWKPSQPEVWNEALRLFGEKYPEIEVVREIGPHSSTEYHDLLSQKLKNRDSSVDVFFMDVIWPPEFAAAGWALPLDGYFTEEKRSRFLNSALLANTFQGKVYGVPFWVSSGLFYYRKDLLDKYGFSVPGTWEEMIEQAGRIIEGEKEANPTLKGYSAQFKQYEGLVCNMLEFIKGAGGEIVSPEGLEPMIDRPEAVGAVRFVRDRIIGEAAPRGVLTYEEPESLALFVQGGAVFHRNWPYAWEVANNAERSRIAGKVGIAKIPHFEGGRSHAALGGWQFAINRHSEKPELAWKFIKFMTSAEMQKFFAIRASQPPVRPALYDDPDIIEANPHFTSFKEVFFTAYPRPSAPFYPALSNVLQKYFSKALSYDEADISSLSEEASRELASVIKKYSVKKGD